MKTIAQCIKTIQQNIQQYEAASCRPPGSVHLLAVSKGHAYSNIQVAAAAGLCDFGENYLQEALPKIQALAALHLRWHFIGPIQSNKTTSIAREFDWVHSVCRCKIAQQLNDNRPAVMPPLNICIQVNIDNEATKSGLNPDAVHELVNFIRPLPHLRLRGLMCIPEKQSNKQQQYATYARLATLLSSLNAQFNLTLDTLSMGMSDDLDTAIHAGSTIVRVGRGIFGERSDPQTVI